MRNWKLCFAGYGYKPYFVEGDDPAKMHQLMAATLDTVIAEIKAIQHDAREPTDSSERPMLADDCSCARPRVGRGRRWWMANRWKELFARIRCRWAT